MDCIKNLKTIQPSPGALFMGVAQIVEEGKESKGRSEEQRNASIEEEEIETIKGYA